MTRQLLVGLTCTALLLVAPVSSADTITISFDGLGDLDAVTNQYAGLTFSNTIALQAGFSLQEFDFPPRSGQVAVSDDWGAITIAFTTPVVAVGGYFTYNAQVRLTAYDAAHGVLGWVTSAFTENYVSSGNSPNEWLGLTFAGIASVSIEGDPDGASFVLDDLTYDTGSTAVPEPASLLLLGMGLVGVLARRRHR